jgi:hypothetical protein
VEMIRDSVCLSYFISLSTSCYHLSQYMVNGWLVCVLCVSVLQLNKKMISIYLVCVCVCVCVCVLSMCGSSYQ